jgi:hypothetical protein
MSEVKKPKSVAEMLAEGQNPSGETVFAPVDTPKQAAEALTNELDNVTLKQLVSLMVLEQKGRLKKANDDEMREKARSAQRERNSKDQDSKALLKQAKCKHRKGGKRGPKTQNVDYAVSQHRFITFVQYIRCLICGMRWYPEDTIEYLLRKGHKISNHTKIGWREACDMMNASTNTMSASESIPTAIGGAGANLVRGYTDAAGLPVVPRITDVDGNVVQNVEI